MTTDKNKELTNELQKELRHVRKRISELSQLLLDYEKEQNIIETILGHLKKPQGEQYTTYGHKGKYALRDIYFKKGVAVTEFISEGDVRIEFPADMQFSPSFVPFYKGDLSKEIAIRVEKSGLYRVNIEADEDWQLTITHEPLFN